MSRILLTVVFLDVGRHEILWVLDVVENAAEGWKPVGVIYKKRLPSCVDDLPHVQPRIMYFLMVVSAAVVQVAVWLVPWSLICCGLSTPRTLAASNFLLLLIYLILLLTVVASQGAACLWSC